MFAIHHFDNCRAAALFGDNIPETVYDNLIKTVKSNLAPFFKYMDFRKQTLALSELHFYDTYVPIVSDVTFVYKYATGVSAAIALADKVVNEGQPARDAYLNFLMLGGSKFPLDELVDAGVDMRSPGPIQRAIKYFSDLVDRLIDAYQEL